MGVRKRANITGPALVYITTTVKDWRPIFDDYKLAATVVNQLGGAAEFYRVTIAGYVLMPSHLHTLLGFRYIEKLSQFMQGFKILSSKKIKGMLSESDRARFTRKGKFRFWMHRFDDVIIISEKQFRIKLEYIHNNPVKSGLVRNPCDYQFSSAMDWLAGTAGLLPIDKEFSWLV
jgi:putative transposase